MRRAGGTSSWSVSGTSGSGNQEQLDQESSEVPSKRRSSEAHRRQLESPRAPDALGTHIPNPNPCLCKNTAQVIEEAVESLFPSGVEDGIIFEDRLRARLLAASVWLSDGFLSRAPTQNPETLKP